jgi:methylated-DNA-protein-cysteine methyltransferase-like protein
MEGGFSQRVWELATSIPEGRVTTYGILAAAAGGGPMAARSITSILSKAPNQKAIPYHRIVYAGGKVWMTDECEDKRRQLFKRERIEVNTNGKIKNFDEVVYYFD